MNKVQIKNILGASLTIRILKIWNWGLKYKCDICGSRVRRKFKQGYPNSTVNKLQIIGGIPRNEDECPVCRSNSRTRLVHLYFKQNTNYYTKKHSILHFAPERGLVWNLIPANGSDYICCDISPKNYLSLHPMQSVDITNIPFGPCSFDLIICNHVLEHIDDDIQAMKEIYRVLKTDGCAILQVPISLKLLSIREGIKADTPQEKESIYGQNDHVRIYCEQGYIDRLEKIGFEVNIWEAYEENSSQALKNDIDPFEKLFICYKR